ncbi:MAG: PQQ-binding-like beta-propeller repeat protein [Oscillospiraceae bacterium]|nr:PQQ-binding-like beta-propeller repeat protein [Oscillospiraceae bacterium]
MKLHFTTHIPWQSANYIHLESALIALYVILAVLTFGSVLLTYISTSQSKRTPGNFFLALIYSTTLVALICTIACFIRFQQITDQLAPSVPSASNDTTEPRTESQDTTPEQTESTEITVPEQTLPTEITVPEQTQPTEITVPEQTQPTEITMPEETEPAPTFFPEYVDSSDPANWGIQWDIIVDENIVDSYLRADPISFGAPEDYFALPGISTFRGNNYRNSAVYGTANVTEQVLEQLWSQKTSQLNDWTGSGWTGQPLIVKWDDATKAIMNLYPEKQAKQDLVEVIYATLDGHIYFYDLEDGSNTRDPLYLGMNFKGTGSLDPRGLPIMYIGSGDYINGKSPRFYIISLIDCSILMEKSGDDPFRQRDWVAFDSAPLVDAETDTLIWLGECGILYTMKLNTAFDKNAGTLTIAPYNPVKTRYSTNRSTYSRYWLGYEASAVIVDRYLYISENGGMFFCIDLNTMELIWAQDTRDDSNSTPVFEWNGTDSGFLYTAPSLHWTSRDNRGNISIYKLDAQTGEIIWEQQFDCYTVDGVSGGIQATPLLGKSGTQLEGLILYAIARTPNRSDGKLVALDTQTGDIVWEKYMNAYTWSSPVAVYNEDGTAHIIVCDSAGNMQLLDALGNVCNILNFDYNIEASPAVYEDILVVGTRGQRVFGIEIK